MRSKLFRLLALALGSVTLAACKDPLCTLNYGYGLTIIVQDSVTTASLVGDGTTVTVREGSYVDSVQQVGTVYQAAGERPGTYTIQVQRAGYRHWSRENVRVLDDGCHVRGVTVNARLQPTL